MLPKINPLTTTGWKNLQQHFSEMKKVKMRDMFANDADRFKKFSIGLDDILFDYSKNIITEKTLQLLLQHAADCQLPAAIQSIFNGDIINGTEKRSLLHMALRNFSGHPIYSEGN